MTTANRIGVSDGLPPETVKVWDPFVRIFHWSLAILFVIALSTPDLTETGHQAAGYAIAALLAARVLWGFVGPRHARFGDFVRSPAETLRFLKDTALLRARRYIGHNPAGVSMVLALIASVGSTCLSGYLMTLDYYWGVKWLEEVHEAIAWTSVALIGLHVAGIIVASFEHRENLVLSMITGRKRAE